MNGRPQRWQAWCTRSTRLARAQSVSSVAAQFGQRMRRFSKRLSLEMPLAWSGSSPSCALANPRPDRTAHIPDASAQLGRAAPSGGPVRSPSSERESLGGGGAEWGRLRAPSRRGRSARSRCSRVPRTCEEQRELHRRGTCPGVGAPPPSFAIDRSQHALRRWSSEALYSRTHVRISSGRTTLGREDLNPFLLSQSEPCCRLHHSPRERRA